MSRTFKNLLIGLCVIPFTLLGACALEGAYQATAGQSRGVLGLTGLFLLGIAALATYLCITRPTVATPGFFDRSHGQRALAVRGAVLIVASPLIALCLDPLKSDHSNVLGFVALLTLFVALMTWCVAGHRMVAVYDDLNDLFKCAATPILGGAGIVTVFIIGFFVSDSTESLLFTLLWWATGGTCAVSTIWSICYSTKRHRNLFVGVIVGIVRVYLPLALSVFAFLAMMVATGEDENNPRSDLEAAAIFILALLVLRWAGRVYFGALINGEDLDPFEPQAEDTSAVAGR